MTVELVPLNPGHFAALYDIISQPQVRKYWRVGPLSMSPDDFSQFLASDAQLQFTIVNTNHQIRGFVRLYGLNARDACARISVLTSPELIGTGAGIVAISKLVEIAFQDWPLRKLYFEASAGAFAQYASALKNIVIKEGLLVQHQWNGSCYEDVVIAAIWRDNWMEADYRHRLIASGRLEPTGSELQ